MRLIKPFLLLEWYKIQDLILKRVIFFRILKKLFLMFKWPIFTFHLLIIQYNLEIMHIIHCIFLFYSSNLRFFKCLPTRIFKNIFYVIFLTIIGPNGIQMNNKNDPISCMNTIFSWYFDQKINPNFQKMCNRTSSKSIFFVRKSIF